METHVKNLSRHKTASSVTWEYSVKNKKVKYITIIYFTYAQYFDNVSIIISGG